MSTSAQNLPRGLQPHVDHAGRHDEEHAAVDARVPVGDRQRLHRLAAAHAVGEDQAALRVERRADVFHALSLLRVELKPACRRRGGGRARQSGAA